MITSATIAATDQPPTALAIPEETRGTPEYPIDGYDLVSFGRSPDRWVNKAKPEPDDKPDFAELVRLLHLTPQHIPNNYIQRPGTYTAMFLVCPTCRSAGPGRICRHCNIARTNATEQRPWSAAAKYCSAWTADAHSRNLRIVPMETWTKAASAVSRLNADTEIADLLSQSARQIVLRGVWHDSETDLNIPLRSMLAYAPTGGRSHDDKLGSLSVTADASHYPWASAAYSKGKHITAALKHDLWAMATDDPRPTHVWTLVERAEPHIVGRRRTTPEMLIAGREALAQLMAAYAKCLATDKWLAFDPELPGALEAWSQFHLEPWMTQGSGGASNFFGVTNAPPLPPGS